jgi:hypothetical protein
VYVAGGACGELSCRVPACLFLCFGVRRFPLGIEERAVCVMIVRPFYYYFSFLAG